MVLCAGFWLVRAFFKQRWAFFGARLVPVGGEIEKGGLRFCCFVQGVAEPWRFGGWHAFQGWFC